MIPFEKYARIKDNYCIGYFGFSNQLLLQLRDVRPFLEQTFQGLNIYIACRDESSHLLTGDDRIVKKSELRSKREEFGQFSELAFDGVNHPIIKMLKEIEAWPCPVLLPIPSFS
jgi:hypothetical protein